MNLIRNADLTRPTFSNIPLIHSEEVRHIRLSLFSSLLSRLSFIIFSGCFSRRHFPNFLCLVLFPFILVLAFPPLLIIIIIILPFILCFLRFLPSPFTSFYFIAVFYFSINGIIFLFVLFISPSSLFCTTFHYYFTSLSLILLFFPSSVSYFLSYFSSFCSSTPTQLLYNIF